MKTKKEYIILAAIILVLALYLYFKEEQRTLYELPVLPEVPAKDISKIEIDKADGKIILKKKGDAWIIDPQEYTADSDRIKGINSTLEKLNLTAMVSEAKNAAAAGTLALEAHTVAGLGLTGAARLRGLTAFAFHALSMRT